MEVEENQPPQKKLKQATLSFFKGKKDDSAPLKKPESQGRKRQNSSGSESPNKIAKLSKPLTVLASTDVPNSKVVARQGNKSSSQDSSDQEVSSSSEADSTGNKTSAKCLMDRFVKKSHNGSTYEISSTNDDVDSTDNTDQIKASGTDKENVCQESEKDVENCEDSEPDCIIISQEPNDPIELKSVNPIQSAGKDKPVASSELDGNKSTKDLSSKSKNCTSASDHESGGKDNADINKSIEIDPDESFTTSLEETSESICTSTPVKPVSGSEVEDVKATPNGTPSSSKKRGKKVDSVKKAEKEVLKQKQKEEREEQRLAKKRKLEEEKAEKEKLRIEKQEAKEKARQELKEKQAQEKMAKDKVREEEKLKKEEERKVKEEQKLKKQVEIEAKQEEKKKKEEEKRQKEEEKQKEEDEKRKKEEKVKMAFQSFFKTKETPQKSASKSSTSSGFFAPFHLKKDMHLAPAVRGDPFCQRKKDFVDEVLNRDQPSSPTYLQQLKSKVHKPKRSGRKLRKNPKPAEEMDIEIVHDSEALKKVFHKVKILRFHTDHRPPYFGTWRKETKLSPRNPYQKDEGVFDYEVDSDEEWEEEEPGESLSCSDGEEEKEDKEEEEEEDGWMVPHGYLSEDEGCNDEDDDVSPEKLKLQQIAKAKAWDEEQKRKFQALPVVVIGCFFEHCPSVAMSGDVRLLYEFKAVVLEKSTPIPTALSTAFELPALDDAPKEGAKAVPGTRGSKKQSVPDEAMPDLIRLVHGNVCGIKRLIKEFRVFWNQNKASSSCLSESYEEDPDESVKEPPADTSMDTSMKDSTEVLNKSQDAANTSISKPKEEGYGCEISKRQLEIKIMAIAARDKRQCPKKTAWFVHDTVLTEYNMTDIQLPNSWVFLTSGPSISPTPKSSSVPSTPAVPKEEDAAGVKKEESNIPAKPVPKDQRSIMDFTFTLTKEEMELKQSQVGSVNRSTSNNEDENKPETAAVNVPQPTNPKDKKSGQRSIMDFAKSSAKGNDKSVDLKIVSDSNSSEVKMEVDKSDSGQPSAVVDLTESHTTCSETVEKPQPVVDQADVILIDDDTNDGHNSPKHQDS